MTQAAAFPPQQAGSHQGEPRLWQTGEAAVSGHGVATNGWRALGLWGAGVRNGRAR